MADLRNSVRSDSVVPPRRDRPAAVLQQSPRRGRRYEAWGWGAVTVGAAVIGGGTGLGGLWMSLTIWLIGAALTIGGIWAIARGRRHLAPVLADLQTLSENERIVLFLREFNADTPLTGSAATRWGGLWSVLWNMPTTAAGVRTQEQQIAGALAPFGRMVALGNPGDELPPLGAERRYAEDGTWQTEVLSALDRADLVLLMAGSRSNLAWEIDQVVRRGEPTRLVLAIGHDEDAYARFRWSMGSLFPQGLPDYPATSLRQRLLRARSVRAVIWFDDDWTPHTQVLAGRLPVIGFARRTLRTLRRGLKPVFVRANLPVRVTPTVPRPRAVKLSVVLILQVLIAPLVFSAVVFALIQVVLSRKGNILAEIVGEISGIFALSVLINLVLLAIIVFLWMWRVWRGGPLAVAIAGIWGIWVPIAVVAFVLSPAEVVVSESPAGMSSVTTQEKTDEDIFSDGSTSSDPECVHTSDPDYQGWVCASPEVDFSETDDDSSWNTDGSGLSESEVESGSAEAGGTFHWWSYLILATFVLGLPLTVTYLINRREVREWVDSRL
ncbi:hypothetical protein NLM24_02725 [Nocardia zapadnayensis]|uniref:hypothetical protein n=1 Tax=Nocardia rhamnosiphila TaxID=426716 RepID=UPI002246430E|nr:hypothetical protein [Nocardia zapadnayensis]MCX0269642.1 hypothetical protein [Nocardia zapadnayensis]